MKDKMLITASTFPRWEGDTEPRFILDYATAMSKYYNVHVLVPMAIGAKENECFGDVHVHRYHYFPIHKWETLCYPGAIASRIKEEKIRFFLIPFLLIAMRYSISRASKKVDFVHAHWLIPQGIVQMRIKNIPFLVTSHGTDITTLNFFPVKQLKKNVLKSAKYITTVSSTLNQYIQKIYQNDKTSVIPMGCNTKRFTPDKRIKNYYQQGGKKVVLFVGRLEEVKGVKYLIDAMQDINNAILVVVGTGNFESELKEQAKKLGEKVKFLGAKTHDELPNIYASADLFVAPSVTASGGDKEGFGLVIIEAMASGIPVIASNSGGIPDIIEDGKNGLLTKEKDSGDITEAIKKIFADENLRKRIIEEGKKTADLFSYEKIAGKYHQIIEQHVKKGKCDGKKNST